LKNETGNIRYLFACSYSSAPIDTYIFCCCFHVQRNATAGAGIASTSPIGIWKYST
jgi:hypothetical protein